MQKVVLATSNAGKVVELMAELAAAGLHIVAQSELNISSPEESGLTFVENALIKARHAAELSGLPAIADDSGLVVPALRGLPGIYSARYSQYEHSDEYGNNSEHKDNSSKKGHSAANIAKLLHDMRAISEAHREAYFYCSLVYLRHAQDPMPLICQGRWPGKIALHATGSGGFGYDPVFFLSEEECTAAQLPAAKKRAISHRGQALQQLLKALLNEQAIW